MLKQMDLRHCTIESNKISEIQTTLNPTQMIFIFLNPHIRHFVFPGQVNKKKVTQKPQKI